MRMNRRATRIAVLGGGFQGCCLALALAQRGFRTTIFEREQGLLRRTLLASEGKIHLGYVYAGDESLQTARTMIRGALTFAPFIARALESSSAGLAISFPFAYAVHRSSFRSAAAMSHYLQAVHSEIRQQASGREDSYFGIDLSASPRERPAARLEDEFDHRTISAVFDTVEVAVRPQILAEALRLRIESDQSIEVRTDFLVTAVTSDNHKYRIEGKEGDDSSERYDHVVNALWAGRLAIDRKRGLEPDALGCIASSTEFSSGQSRAYNCRRPLSCSGLSGTSFPIVTAPLICRGTRSA
jgi:glycine/D-amino acid oxidase-like deaminating enzyme